jgi:hypothetical protein
MAARGLDTGGLGLPKIFVIISLNTTTLSKIWIKEDEPMSTPILFVRERNQVGQGDKKPRFTVVGTVGTDLTINVNHIRKSELEQIASKIDGEIVYLTREKDSEERD